MRNSSNYWISTDLHLGHARIKEFCGRPTGFEKKILDNLSKTMKSNDVFICLGDVCWGQDEKWHRKLDSSIPCTKRWLVKGNHDKKTNSWYYDHGWNFVGNAIWLSLFGKKILLSHKPRNANGLDINIHGHLHNTGHHTSFDDGKHKSFYIEHHYMPINLKTLVRK